MTVEFYNNKDLLFSYDKVIELDLDYFSNLTTSNATASEFDISLCFFHTSTEASSIDYQFVDFWNKLTVGEIPKTFYLVLVTNNGEILGSGNAYEWNIDYENFEINIHVVSCVKEILKQETSENIKFQRFFNINSNINNIKGILINFFQYCFYKVFKNCNVLFQFDNAINYLANIIEEETRDVSSSTNKLLFKSNWDMDKADFIKTFSIITGTHTYYNQKNNQYIIRPVDVNNVIDISGFISGYSFNQDEYYPIESFLQKIETRNMKNNNTSKNIAKTINNYIEQYQQKLMIRKQYNIWGFANDSSIIQPGQYICLNGKKYIVREISYETETIESQKTFEAKCIKV